MVLLLAAARRGGAPQATIASCERTQSGRQRVQASKRASERASEPSDDCVVFFDWLRAGSVGRSVGRRSAAGSSVVARQRQPAGRPFVESLSHRLRRRRRRRRCFCRPGRRRRRRRCRSRCRRRLAKAEETLREKHAGWMKREPDSEILRLEEKESVCSPRTLRTRGILPSGLLHFVVSSRIRSMWRFVPDSIMEPS